MNNFEKVISSDSPKRQPIFTWNIFVIYCCRWSYFDVILYLCFCTNKGNKQFDIRPDYFKNNPMLPYKQSAFFVKVSYFL